MRIAVLTIAGAVLASATAHAQQKTVVLNRTCSGLPNHTCIAVCDPNQAVVSIAVAFVKNGMTAWGEMAPTSGKGIAFITPKVTYDQVKVRLVCVTV